MMLIMALVFVLGTFGMNFQITTALMATKEFHEGPTEYGMLGSIMAIGSLAGALLAAAESAAAPGPARRLAGFTVSTAIAALAPDVRGLRPRPHPDRAVVLTALTTANAMVQLSVDPQMRGRVMALYMAVFMGGTPIGAPIIGWIGDVLGARWTIGIGALAVGLSLVAVAAYLYRRENVAGALRVPPPAADLGHGPTGRPAAAEAVR